MFREEGAIYQKAVRQASFITDYASKGSTEATNGPVPPGRRIAQRFCNLDHHHFRAEPILADSTHYPTLNAIDHLAR